MKVKDKLYNMLCKDYEKLKYNYNEVVLKNDKININSWFYYEIKKLIREVNDKKLVIKWCKKKYKYRNLIPGKSSLKY